MCSFDLNPQPLTLTQVVGQSYDEYLGSHPDGKIDWQAAAKDFRQMMEVPTPYTPHSAPYTLHPTPYTLHPTSYTLHPTP